MIVSNFEIYKRGVDFWTSDYHLQVTNLADKEIEFLIECHLTAGEELLSTSTNFTGISVNIDSGWPDKLSFRRRKNVLIGRYSLSVPSHSSSIYHLRRSIDHPGQNPEWFRFIGYIVLRVPPRREELNKFLLKPQQDSPVRVILNATQEIYRESFTSHNLYRAEGDSRSIHSIEISTGKSENEIDPEGFGVLESLRDFQQNWRDRQMEHTAIAGANLLFEEDRIPALFDLLSAIKFDQDEIDAANEFLAELEADIRICGA